MRVAISDTVRPDLLATLGGKFGSATVLLLALFSVLSSGCNRKPNVDQAQNVPAGVYLRKTSDGWELSRNGTPYFIRGAGGDGSRALLARLGGNSVRTWGTDDLKVKLDAAHKHGLSVAVGIWLGHERHGFNYNDPDQVSRQKEKVREAILRYKDHPAVLLWGLGNEMEGYGKGDSKAIWAAVSDLARLVKELDPKHPTMTVVAEIGGDRVPCIHRLCPAIDIVGINSYAGARSIPQRYRDAGGTKPYILTEFGPPGSWEVSKTTWGAAIEPSSTEKALSYRHAYQKAVVDAKGLCLGSYAFIWGHKQEATATWFGMLLPDGSRLAAADVMSSLWTGKPPPNRCPHIERLWLEGPAVLKPGTVITAKLTVTDPENDPLTVRWVLQEDPVNYSIGGDAEKAPPTFPKAILSSTLREAKVRIPSSGGAYRLFAYVHDGQGGAAVANIPLHVKGSIKQPPGAPATLPLVIYDEASRKQLPYMPSGWMGNTKSLKFDPACPIKPHSGQTCIKIEYTATDQWAAIAWQHPETDFGDKPGGWNLTGAKHLSVWLRGETGREKVTIEFGILGKDKKFPDTAKGKLENVALSTEWRQFRLDVTGKDLTRIKTGLVISLRGEGKPTTIYLDDCRYE
jgi:hypothetical protein